MLWLINRSGRRVARGVKQLRAQALSQADAIVTTNEVTDRHGTGVLLRRMFGSSRNILSIRSTSLYPEHQFGEEQLQFNHEGLSRQESFARVAFALNGSTVRRVLCVPFHPDELLTAIALKELFNVPLCTYVMDDNNVFSCGIPDELMREALTKSNLRLAISPEMRDAYEEKFGLKFWVLPPVVAPEAVQRTAETCPAEPLQARKGVLVGSLWSPRWLERLRRVVKESALTLWWYGNATAPWLKATMAELRADGIIAAGFVPEAELRRELKHFAYAVIPSGNLDSPDDRPEIARLSLPTRMPFLLAAANMPMIVLGSAETAAARFLQRCGIGRVSPYDGRRLREAVEEICRPEVQTQLRQRAAAQSTLFSAAGLGDWIWKSLGAGEACDDRFEKVFGPRHGERLVYLEPPVPVELTAVQVPVYQVLSRLKRQGFAPEFILDVGAGTGDWSAVARRVFPQARFVLIDPLQGEYARANDRFLRANPAFEYVPVALGRDSGLDSDSGPGVRNGSRWRGGANEKVFKAPVWTLDKIAVERRLAGRGLLKLDARFACDQVLNEGSEVLRQVDALVTELPLVASRSPGEFLRVCGLLESFGFRYYDDLGAKRCPEHGTMLEKAVLFVRDKLLGGVRMSNGNGGGQGRLLQSWTRAAAE